MRAVHLVAPGSEKLVDRPLDHAREAQGWLGPQLPLITCATCSVVGRQAGQRTGEKILQLRTHARRLAAALADDLSGLLVVEQGEQQVLKARKLVSPTGGILQRAPNRLFQLWA